MRIRGAVIAFLATLFVVPGGLAVADHVETFVSFDPALAEFPEGIAVDKTGNVYTSLTLRDEIRMIAPDGTQSVFAEFAPGTGPVGLAVDAAGTLYVAASGLDIDTFETDPELRGVYRVDRDGSFERLPGSGDIAFPNDVTLDKRGNVYVTDSAAGAVWRIARGGAAELWVQDPRLEGTGELGFGFPVGANGIAFSRNALIVASSERGLVVRVPVRPDGSPGALTTLVAAPELVGSDGIALDAQGNVYAATVQNTVVRARLDGSVDTLATAQDGLNQPSTLAFGTGRSERRTLFVANFSIFAPEPTPGILKVPAGRPGQPVP